MVGWSSSVLIVRGYCPLSVSFNSKMFTQPTLQLQALALTKSLPLAPEGVPLRSRGRWHAEGVTDEGDGGLITEQLILRPKGLRSVL